MTIHEFIAEFQKRNITNTKANPDAVSQYIKNELEIKTYIPFRTKREVAEMIVTHNTKEVDGIKRHDSINAYIAFVIAMIATHTKLEVSSDPVADYDLLAENGLLSLIVAEFQSDYDECDIIRKMALSSALEDNNINVLLGHFLNTILQKLDGVGEVLKDKLENLDIKDVLGTDFKQEDLAKLSGFLDKYK